jgi:hypothetical protein
MKFENVYIDGAGSIANPDISQDIRDEIRSQRGQHLDITIEHHKAEPKKRTLDQNAYLHAEPFQKLAKAWGESVSRAKLICMGEFWGYEPCRVTGMLLPVKPHTSDMTVAECTLFIDWLIPWGNEQPDVEQITEPMDWHERRRAA